MNENIINKMLENTIQDLGKKEIDQFERAQIIKAVLNNTNSSIRSLASRLNIPKSTLDDWLLWNKITEEKYNRLRDKGHTHIEIYKSLRTNKLENKQIKDYLLERVKRDVTFYSNITKEEIKKDTETELKILLNIISKIIK